MLQVLPDVFLMEAYVNEKYKVTNNDSIVAVKQTFYPEIFAHHKIDSTDFYETLDYFQSNPSKFSDLLIKLDSVLQKIKPLDTTKTAEIKPPENVEKLLNYRGRADQISTAFDKDGQLIKKIKYRREQNSK